MRTASSLPSRKASLSSSSAQSWLRFHHFVSIGGNNGNGGYGGGRGYEGSGQGQGSGRGLGGERRGYKSGQASEWQGGRGDGGYSRQDQSGEWQSTFSSVINVSDGRYLSCGMEVTGESEGGNLGREENEKPLDQVTGVGGERGHSY